MGVDTVDVNPFGGGNTATLGLRELTNLEAVVTRNRLVETSRSTDYYCVTADVRGKTTETSNFEPVER